MATKKHNADRTVARAVSGNNKCADTNRAFIAGGMKTRCTCGATPLIPSSHKPDCEYRIFWEAARDAADEMTKWFSGRPAAPGDSGP